MSRFIRTECILRFRRGFIQRIFRTFFKDSINSPGSILTLPAKQVVFPHLELVCQVPVLAKEFLVLLFEDGILVFDLLELNSHFGSRAAVDFQLGIFLGVFLQKTPNREDQFLPAHGFEPAVQFLQFRPHEVSSGACCLL